MSEDIYRILYEGQVVADNMTLHTARLLLKALFEEAWREHTIAYTVEKVDKREVKANDLDS